MKIAIVVSILIVACILGAYINIQLPMYYEYLLREMGIFKLTYNDLDAQKFIMMRFVLLWIIGMFVLTNNWARTWFSWVIICLVCHYNTYALERVHFILFFLILFQLLRDRLNPKGVTIIFNTICVVALLHIVWMVLQKHGVNFIYYGMAGHENTPLGVYGNTNNTGALIALSLPCFFRKKWWIGLLPCFYGLYLASAFVSVVAASVGILAYIYLTQSKMILILTLIIILSCVFIYGYTSENPKNFKDGNKRIHYWTKIYNEVSLKPVKGHGVGIFKYIFPQIDLTKYKTGSPNNIQDKPTSFLKAHNDYLELAFNQGYVGLLLFLGFVFSHISKFARGVKTHQGMIAFTAVAIAMVMSFGHFLIHSTLILLPSIYLSIMTNQTKEIKDEKIVCGSDYSVPIL